MNRTLVLAVFLMFCTPCVAQEMSVQKLLARSDAAMQEQINALCNAKSEVEMFHQLHSLKKRTADEEEIAKQIAIFIATPDLDEKQQLMAPVVLHRLQLQPKIIIRALAPHLDSDNKRVRSFVRDWFQAHDICAEGPSAFQAVNYADYLDYVRGNLMRNQETPPAFIEFIYERSPDRALRVFFYAAGMGDTVARLIEMRKEYDASQREFEKDGRGEKLAARLAEWHKEMAAKQGKEPQSVPPVPPVPPLPPAKQLLAEMPQHLESKPPKNILLSEHIINNVIWLKEHRFDERCEKALPEAKQQLAKLAESDRWWVRLYVAEIMRQHCFLRQADVLEKLGRDSNALVSKSARGRIGQNSSAKSREVGNKTLVAPRNVEARAIGANSTQVTWDASEGATSYTIMRRQPDTETEFKPIATNVTDTSYTDTGLAKGVLYEYGIIANQDSTSEPAK